MFPHPFLGTARAIQIESDGNDTADPAIQPREDWTPGRDELVSLIHDLGIVGMGNLRGEPAHRKLASRPEDPVRRMILNGVEAEPYVTCDYVLMMDRALDIVHAAKILKQALSLEKICLAVGEDKLEALETVRSKLFSLGQNFLEVVAVPSGMPQGEESLLARSVFPEIKNSEAHAQPGTRVLNVATALAILDAVRMRKPLYERVVTITGECVVEPKNLLVRIGTSLSDLVRNCKGILRKPGNLVMGGPLTGVSVDGMAVPVIKGTQAVVALTPEDTKPKEVLPCIRCGRCIEACPVFINPCLIALGIESENFETCGALNAGRCIRCGNCSFVCPSKRPMLGLVSKGRELACHGAC